MVRSWRRNSRLALENANIRNVPTEKEECEGSAGDGAATGGEAMERSRPMRRQPSQTPVPDARGSAALQEENESRPPRPDPGGSPARRPERPWPTRARDRMAVGEVDRPRRTTLGRRRRTGAPASCSIAAEAIRSSDAAGGCGAERQKGCGGDEHAFSHCAEAH